MTVSVHPRELLTVAVPCLNEEANLPATMADLQSVIPRLPMEVHVVLIDDASSDATRDVMAQMCERYPNTRMKVNERNLGPGRSVMRLYDELDEDSWFTALPGDNEIVCESLVNYVKVRDRYDVILGYLQNPVIRTVTRRAASTVFTALASATYGFSFRYLNGTKLYKVWAFRGIEVVGGGHGFGAELLAKALLREPGLRIGEVPFMARGRAMGNSTAFTAKAITRAVREFYAGHRSVAEYRQSVIARETARQKR